jgi:ElaB/YqjD/DUF883 family membrane-anchored ribosome-binding protein
MLRNSRQQTRYDALIDTLSDLAPSGRLALAAATVVLRGVVPCGYKRADLNEIGDAAFSCAIQAQEIEIMAQSQYGGRSDISDRASELKDTAADKLKEVADRAQDLASDAVDHLRETGAGEVAGNLKGAVDKSIKDQPMATLALAAVVGFVLGALWKS